MQNKLPIIINTKSYIIRLCIKKWPNYGLPKIRYNQNNYHLLYEQLKALEDTSPFFNDKQNFAEIARHYIFVIYCFGVIESYIKIIFPLFIIPLLWGVKHKLSRTRVYLLVLVILYLLMIYYSLLERDFIQKRFLFAAVFFSYPWIGLGLAQK